MAFSEGLKSSVRRKGHLRCCVCHGFAVDIHHITPQAEDGSDTEDNAAPLCPTCHGTYGANPTKWKTIREARDLWFEICATRFASDAVRVDRLIGQLEGLIPVIPAFQDLLNRIAKPEPQSHPLTGHAAGSSSASATLSPGGVEAEGARVNITVHDWGTVTSHDSANVEVIEDEDNFKQEPREESEILEALERLFDQVWYNRHWNHRTEIEDGTATVDRGLWQQALAAAARVEQKYKDDPEALGPWDDFEWGMVNGKLSALRWVLGDKWDVLDT